MSDSLNQLPYYREYVEQILRPRVGRMIDELRSQLTEQVWGVLLERMAQDQRPGSPTDAQSIDKLRSLLTETLGLRLNVQLGAEFGTASNGTAAPAHNSGAGNVNPAANNVVERTFPNNPLARAVGGVRSAGR